MYLAEDGYVRPNIAPPDPNFALAMIWAHAVQKREAKRAALAEAGLLPAPRHHDLLDRLTRAGSAVVDQVTSWTHPGSSHRSTSHHGASRSGNPAAA